MGEKIIMKKIVNIFLAVLITLFSFPIGGLSVNAEENSYNDIEDGEYNLTAKLLKEGSDEESAAADFMSEEVTLSVKDGEKQITFFIPNNEAMEFKKFELEGVNPTIESGTGKHKGEIVNGNNYTFALQTVKTKLSSIVTYSVSIPPNIEFEHEDLGMDIKLIGLDELPKMEEETPEEQPEETEKPEQPEETEKPEEEKPTEPGEGSNEGETEKPEEETDEEESNGEEALSLNNLPNGYYTVDVSHLHAEKEDTSSMARYLGDTVFLSVNNDEVEMTMTVNDNTTVTKVQVENKDPIVRKVDDAKSYETFKLDNLSKFNNAYAEYQAPFQGSIHYGNATFRIMLDEETIKSVSKEDAPGYGLEPVVDEEEDPEEEVEDPEEEVEDPKEDPKEEPKEEAILTPDKAYEINYTILNENGKTASVADGFFIKPGTLLEKDGKTYFQLTVENAEMVKSLSNKYGDYILVNEKDGTKTMQLRVPNDLSDMDLDMHIVVSGVPGFPGYDSKHGAVLTFDKNSKKSISVEDVELVASGDKENGNGPFVEGAKPKEPTPSPTPNPTPGKPTPEPTPTPEPKPGKGKVNLTPDKAYEINYTILQENGKDVSVADDFFVKPGKLLVKDGKTYLQMTVGSADMVKALSNKYGEYILVSKNKDGSMTMQIRVPNDLSDVELDMHIVVPAGAVPGFPGYDEKHGAILTFDKNSKKEISVDGLEIAASGDKGNENGPYVEGAGNGNGNGTPGKPSFGDNGNENGDKKFGKNGNPKTGDTSQIFFFASLLMSSLAVLVLQLRRRLAA